MVCHLMDLIRGRIRDWAGPSNSMQRGRVIMADQGQYFTQQEVGGMKR